MDVIDDEDIKFKELLEERRHKEIITAINKLAVLVSQNRSIDVVSAIEKNTQSLGTFVVAVQNIKPQVSVETNQYEVIKALNAIASDIKNANSQAIEKGFENILNELKKEKEFKVNKNQNGYIESVTAKTK